ncbi:hypothetical protein ScPMuIL_010140 [Solemya velum]
MRNAHIPIDKKGGVGINGRIHGSTGAHIEEGNAISHDLGGYIGEISKNDDVKNDFKTNRIHQSQEEISQLLIRFLSQIVSLSNVGLESSRHSSSLDTAVQVPKNGSDAGDTIPTIIDSEVNGTNGDEQPIHLATGVGEKKTDVDEDIADDSPVDINLPKLTNEVEKLSNTDYDRNSFNLTEDTTNLTNQPFDDSHTVNLTDVANSTGGNYNSDQQVNSSVDSSTSSTHTQNSDDTKLTNKTSSHLNGQTWTNHITKNTGKNRTFTEENLTNASSARPSQNTNSTKVTKKPDNRLSPSPTDHYPYNATLGHRGEYFLFWKFFDENVTFEVHVRTYGYVGFGLSLHGGMYPADVIIGWVDNGRPHFADYHTLSDSTPILDPSQDWVLLYSEENDFGTILKFSRPLDTCDENDRVIDNRTTYVIYAYSDDDPVSLEMLPYHGSVKRGQKQIFLTEPDRARGPSPDTKFHDFVNNNVTLPTSKTFYLCTIVRPPKDTPHHFTRFEPVVSHGNREVIHHLGIFGCGDIGDVREGFSFDCLAEQDLGRKCINMYAVITKGATAYDLPEHVGISFGKPSDPQYFMVQIHYNNAAGTTGIQDSSGIRAYYTPKLRPYDAGVLLAGVIISYWNVIIPPFQERFVSSGHCPSECLEKGFAEGTENIKIFAAAQHTHLLGSEVITRHLRNGTELKPILDDRHMNFNFQGGTFIDEVSIERGDTIRVDCTYDTKGTSSFTYAGYGTSQEMCLSFIMYYPRMSLGQCYSMPKYQQQGSQHHKTPDIKSWNFRDSDTKKRFQDMVFQSDYMISCQGRDYEQRCIVVAMISSDTVNPYPPYIFTSDTASRFVGHLRSTEYSEGFYALFLRVAVCCCAYNQKLTSSCDGSNSDFETVQSLNQYQYRTHSLVLKALTSYQQLDFWHGQQGARS